MSKLSIKQLADIVEDCYISHVEMTYRVDSKVLYRETGLSAKIFAPYGGLYQFEETYTIVPELRKQRVVSIMQDQINKMIKRDGVWSMNRYINERGTFHHGTLVRWFGSLVNVRKALRIEVPEKCYNWRFEYSTEEYRTFFRLVERMYGYVSERNIKRTKRIRLQTIIKNFQSLQNACKIFDVKYKKSSYKTKFFKQVEELILSIFKKNGFELSYIEEMTWPWLTYKDNLYVDLFIPILGLAIEIDGPQHFKQTRPYHKTREDFEEARNRDQVKDIEVPRHGYALIRINEYNLPFLEEMLEGWVKKLKLIYDLCAF